VTREEGKKPALVMLDHFDYSFANEHDIAGAAKAAHQYDVPILYNGAYTVGISRSMVRRSASISSSAAGTSPWHLLLLAACWQRRASMLIKCSARRR